MSDAARVHAPRSGSTAFGERPILFELIVVSPCWGRLSFAGVTEGERVETGRVLGWLTEQGSRVPIKTHCEGSFVGWIAVEGERVAPGRVLARIAPA